MLLQRFEQRTTELIFTHFISCKNLKSGKWTFHPFLSLGRDTARTLLLTHAHTHTPDTDCNRNSRYIPLATRLALHFDRISSSLFFSFLICWHYLSSLANNTVWLSTHFMSYYNVTEKHLTNLQQLVSSPSLRMRPASRQRDVAAKRVFKESHLSQCQPVIKHSDLQNYVVATQCIFRLLIKIQIPR